MIEFIKDLLAGKYDVKGLFDFAIENYNNVKESDLFALITDKITGVLGGFLPIVMIVIGAFFVIWGQKLLGIAKFVVSALGGYVIGSFIVTPIINNIFPLKETLCGLIVCVVCAVCCKSVYILGICGATGVLSYVLFYANGIIPITLPTEGNRTLCFIVCAILVLTVLITRKHLERIGTAAVGAVILVEAVARNYVAAIDPYKIWIMLAVWVLGYLYQYKKRKRY